MAGAKQGDQAAGTQNPTSPVSLQGFKGKSMGKECRVCDQLLPFLLMASGEVTGCFRNLSHAAVWGLHACGQGWPIPRDLSSCKTSQGYGCLEGIYTFDREQRTP